MTIWSLSSLLSGLFQELRCDAHLVENLNLLFGQHIVCGLSHKSPHEYHSLYMLDFDSVVSFIFAILSETVGTMNLFYFLYICCVFHFRIHPAYDL